MLSYFLIVGNDQTLDGHRSTLFIAMRAWIVEHVRNISDLMRFGPWWLLVLRSLGFMQVDVKVGRWVLLCVIVIIPDLLTCFFSFALGLGQIRLRNSPVGRRIASGVEQACVISRPTTFLFHLVNYLLLNIGLATLFDVLLNRFIFAALCLLIDWFLSAARVSAWHPWPESTALRLLLKFTN